MSEQGFAVFVVDDFTAHNSSLVQLSEGLHYLSKKIEEHVFIMISIFLELSALCSTGYDLPKNFYDAENEKRDC